MIKCKECGKQFKNNLGGQLTIHLKKVHNMSLRDYVIKFEYDNKPPKCICGLCNEMPVFSRGEFLRYAKFHDRFKVREKLYIKKFGNPTCSEKTCNKIIKKFIRAVPQKYCSKKCMGLNVGFSLEKTQDKIKDVVLEKYGVTNIRNIPRLQKKAKENLRKAWKNGDIVVSDETRKKHSINTKKLWENPDYEERVRKGISRSILNNPKELKRRSEWITDKNLNNDSFKKKSFEGSKSRFSKLHQRIRTELDLGSLGFKPEQLVGGKFADELNEEKKLIVEINGDYVHANPRIYGPDFEIRLRGQSYLAKEKWEADKKRSEKLKSLGYNIIIIWESDDFLAKKNEILKSLN